MDRLQEYFGQEATRRPRYLGQLEPAFQQALAGAYAGTSPADAAPSAQLRKTMGLHPRDLPGHEEMLLGGNKFWAKRVLEVLPPSGVLSSYIATRAAELVVLDAPLETTPDLTAAERRRRSWWSEKHALGFEAQAVYADLSAPPDDLGQFDVAVLVGALSRLAEPFLALQRIAGLARSLIVTEALDTGLSQIAAPVALFTPDAAEDGGPGWRFSEAAVKAMLASLGFSETIVTRHSLPASGGIAIPYVTITARKPAANVTVARQPAQPSKARVTHANAAALCAYAEKCADDLPMPTAQGRFSVAGTDDTYAFSVLGRAGFKALISTLDRAGVDIWNIGRVLDFGCGVGRVGRYWSAVDGIAFHGTDINPDSVAWCQQNLTFGQFGVNGLDPVLSYPDNHFDFAYALSVFTHLPEAIQEPWLRELTRVIRPGGLLYFTTHGTSYRKVLIPQMREKFDLDELVVTGAEDPGSNYCGAFHPRHYVESRMLAPCALTLVEFTPEGAAGNPTQDSWLVRKT
jgi:SAM-dependent methyltransferase